jgi:hypothetical protein
MRRPQVEERHGDFGADGMTPHHLSVQSTMRGD